MSINIPDYKRVLYIDLEKQVAQFKLSQYLWSYIGGIGLSYKLVIDNIDDSPLVLSTGPLAGLYPYASKANLSYISNNRLIEKYGGGSIAGMLNLSGIDAIVFLNQTSDFLRISIIDDEVIINEESKENFRDKRSDFMIDGDSVTSQRYFSFGDFSKNPHHIAGGISIDINSTVSIDVKRIYDYESQYNAIIDSYRDVTVEPRNNPSCLGCPLGCDLSSSGEDNENIAILPRCLISCAYAVDIYKEISTVYNCLSSIGYSYHHSDLENIPLLIGETRLELIDKLNSFEKK